MQYSGDVTLPDGRQFHAVVKFTAPEMDFYSGTGSGGEMVGAEIYYPDGEEVPAEVQNEPVKMLPPNYHDCIFLWELVVDLVCQQPPDEPDYGDWD